MRKYRGKEPSGIEQVSLLEWEFMEGKKVFSNGKFDLGNISVELIIKILHQLFLFQQITELGKENLIGELGLDG